MNTLWTVFLLITLSLLIWWVSRWKFPMPATIRCRVEGVETQEKGYRLRLEVLSVTVPEPVDIFDKWAKTYMRKRLPQPGHHHTFFVPASKMRAELKPGTIVDITGRVFQPIGSGLPELSIHGAREE